MLLRIDHMVIAVRDLDDAADELERCVGLAATGGGRHPTLGTQNRLTWLGDTYLELVSIADPGVADGSWLGVPTIAALERGGGLATWAIATDSIVADVAALGPWALALATRCRASASVPTVRSSAGGWRLEAS